MINIYSDTVHHTVFSTWWNSDTLLCDNPYVEDTPAWWAWEGWCAALRHKEKDATT